MRRKSQADRAREIRAINLKKVKYTVFYDQINRTTFQVKAETPEEAETKADKLYRKHFELPSSEVLKGWLTGSDGEDK